MEHRHSPRLPANMKILVYRCGLPLAVGWLRNISRRGLFVASDYEGIGPDQLLEIELLEGQGGDAHRRCRALVAHRTVEGFGLVVDDECSASRGWMEVLLDKCRRRHAAFSILRATAEARP